MDRDGVIGLNYIMARQESGLDDSFTYTQNEPGSDYYQFSHLNAGTKYTFRIILPTAFPYDSPTLVLSSPKRLPGFTNDIPLEQLGSSHNFHLNGKRGDGISICYASCSWKPNSCISLIILKAVLWCTAYGRYLTDGRCIDEHLIEIRREIEGEGHG